MRPPQCFSTQWPKALIAHTPQHVEKKVAFDKPRRESHVRGALLEKITRLLLIQKDLYPAVRENLLQTQRGNPPSQTCASEQARTQLWLFSNWFEFFIVCKKDLCPNSAFAVELLWAQTCMLLSTYLCSMTVAFNCDIGWITAYMTASSLLTPMSPGHDASMWENMTSSTEHPKEKCSNPSLTMHSKFGGPVKDWDGKFLATIFLSHLFSSFDTLGLCHIKRICHCSRCRDDLTLKTAAAPCVQGWAASAKKLKGCSWVQSVVKGSVLSA